MSGLLTQYFRVEMSGLLPQYFRVEMNYHNEWSITTILSS